MFARLAAVRPLRCHAEQAAAPPPPARPVRGGRGGAALNYVWHTDVVDFQASAFTPLRVPWPYSQREIIRGIQIVEKPTFNETTWDFWNLRRTETEHALDRSHWLRLDANCEEGKKDAVLDDLVTTLRNAMLGFQLWCPKGWDGIIIGARRSGAGLTVETVSIPEPYPNSLWGRMLSVKKCDPAQLPVLVEGTLAALQSKSTRQKNPFQFLEIGLQTAFNHYRAGALLWTVGLDGLLGAEKRDVFKARLIRLLGKDTRVFPEDAVGRRPSYTVDSVAGKVFDWRNLIAHGKEILEDYRKPLRLEFKPAEPYDLSVEDWTKEILYCESALFMLLASLCKIITDGLLPTLGNKRAWDRWLESTP